MIYIYISKRQSDLATSQEFYFYKTSHVCEVSRIKTLVEISEFTTSLYITVRLAEFMQ